MEKIRCHRCREHFEGDPAECDIIWFDWFDTDGCAQICPKCAEEINRRNGNVQRTA